MKTGYVGTRKMHDEDCRTVYTLNTWTDDKKAQAREYLEQGYWVRFASTAIGHTRAMLTESAGLKWAEDEFAGILRIADREENGDTYCQLV